MNARSLCLALCAATLFSACGATGGTDQATALTLEGGSSPAASLPSDLSAVGPQRDDTALLGALEAGLAEVAPKRLWSHVFFSDRPNDRVESAALCDRDLLLITRDTQTGEGRLHSIDAVTGTHRFELSIGKSPVSQLPSASGSFATVITKDGRLYVCDRRTGARPGNDLYARLDAVLPTKSAVATDTTVFVDSISDDRLHALNPVNGLVGWYWRLDGRIAAGPLATPPLPRNLVIVATSEGEVVAFPPQPFDKGRPKALAWRHRILDEVSGPITYAEERVDGRILASVLVPCADKGLYCLDAATGEPRWIRYGDSKVHSAAISCGPYVVARRMDSLQAYDLSRGRPMWSQDADATAFDHAIAGDAQGLWLQKGSRIALIEPNSGALRKEADAGDFAFVLGSSTLDLLLGITAEGAVVALR